MKPDYNKKIARQLADIYAAVADLPMAKRHRIINRAEALAGSIRKAHRSGITLSAEEGDTHDQIAGRYIAQKAIFDAMMQGRKITFLDAAEFRCSEMHTQMACIRRQIEAKSLPVTLRSEWVEFNKKGGRCKQYWLEENTNN